MGKVSFPQASQMCDFLQNRVYHIEELKFIAKTQELPQSQKEIAEKVCFPKLSLLTRILGGKCTLFR